MSIEFFHQQQNRARVQRGDHGDILFERESENEIILRLEIRDPHDVVGDGVLRPGDRILEAV